MRRECPKLSEDVIRTTECRNIGSKRMFRVTCSFSLKSLSHSSAITSFLLRYPDLVSPRTFSVKKFHRISWNHYLIGREYRQENYPEMWNLGSADRTMSAAHASLSQTWNTLHPWGPFWNRRHLWLVTLKKLVIMLPGAVFGRFIVNKFTWTLLWQFWYLIMH